MFYDFIVKTETEFNNTQFVYKTKYKDENKNENENIKTNQIKFLLICFIIGAFPDLFSYKTDGCKIIFIEMYKFSSTIIPKILQMSGGSYGGSKKRKQIHKKKSKKSRKSKKLN